MTLFKNILFLSVFFFFCVFLSPVFARETCTDDSDCLDSINNNSYLLNDNLENIVTSLSLDPDNSIALISTDDLDDFNSNMTEFLQVFGIFAGMLLFANFFGLVGLFLYKR